VLISQLVDTRDIYEKDLKNMVLENVEYEELVETRNRLVPGDYKFLDAGG